MKFARFFTSAVILACTGAGGASAANLRSADQPAEFPPASYTGQQYVDSRGCVYIRAGIDGNVTWVPRVTRGREHICNAQPTFAKPVEKNLPVIADTPAETAKPVKPAAQAAKPAAPAVRAAAAQPKPRTQRAPMTTIASITTPPRLIKPVQPAPKARVAAKTAPPAAPAAASCSQVSAVARKHMTGAGLRCGPQAESPVGRNVAGAGARRAAAPVRTVSAPAQQRGNATGGTRLFSPAVYDNPAAAQVPVRVPEGYRNVWEDGRLNPNRGPQTAAGTAQMDLVWTQTLPRRLIDRTSGQDVTRLNPNLRYPFTNLTIQVQTDAEAARAAAARSPGVVSTKSRAPVKSAPAKAAPAKSAPAAADRSFVQVGTFGVPDNAHKTALRLQRAGLPVRIWTTERKGKPYRIVVAGPFASDQGAQSALGAVRKAGFGDAFLRR